MRLHLDFVIELTSDPFGTLRVKGICEMMLHLKLEFLHRAKSKLPPMGPEP